MCGKPGCRGECGITAPGGPYQNYPMPGTPAGNRNSMLHGYTDTDVNRPEGHNTKTLTPPEIAMFAQVEQLRYLRLQKDQLFDHSHPVDEYGPPGNPGAVTTFTIQPDYDMPEKIDNIVYVIPVGTTLAQIQLGQRTINLYQGAALTAPIASFLPIGCILNSDDTRQCTFTGATGQPYVGLSGFALTRGQFS
jgi:hypothetical protein